MRTLLTVLRNELADPFRRPAFTALSNSAGMAGRARDKEAQGQPEPCMRWREPTSSSLGMNMDSGQAAGLMGFAIKRKEPARKARRNGWKD